jgi:Ca2+/Na+ antiporter
MKNHIDLDIRPRFVHYLWAAIYVLLLIWGFTFQPLGAWGSWIAFIILVASLLAAFWDATETDDASYSGLVVILLAVLASAFNDDKGVATLAREHIWVLVIDLVLLALIVIVLVVRAWSWDRKHKQHQKESSLTIDKMFLQITEALWER